MTEPKFHEMSHVRIVGLDVRTPRGDHLSGHVVEHRWKDGRWLYKISHLSDGEDGDDQGIWDSWYPEAWLEPIPDLGGSPERPADPS